MKSIKTLLENLAEVRKRKKCSQHPFAADDFVPNQSFDLSSIPLCPECGSDDVAIIIYGKPTLTRQILEGLESGKIISGGCMIHGGAPQWYCHHCKKDFGHLSFQT